MAVDSLVKTGKKQNNNKSGAAKADQLRKRTEAEARQEKYAKLSLEQKLAQPALGAKERKKLLAKQQNQKGG